MIHAFHGNLGSAADWEGLAVPGLVAHDLWADLSADPELSLEGWGNHFAAKTAESDPDPVLLGYSMGGRLALHAMAAAPDLWKAAILISTHPGLTGKKERADRIAADLEWSRKVRDMEWEAFLDSWNRQGVLEGSARIPPSQRFLKGRREAIAQGFVNWSVGRQDLAQDRLKKAVFPVLWITGQNDQKFSNFPEKMQYVFRNFKHVAIKGGGHRVLFEKPDQVAESIRDFLGSLVP